MSDADFIRANTRLMPPSLVPELRLWLADELTPLWQATETLLDIQNCAPPYWAFAWAGGQALARYMLDQPNHVAGHRVFELAAGGGVGAIAAAKAGAADVIAQEIDPLARAAIALNAAENTVALTITDRRETGDSDLILAGDICYDRAMVDALLPWLRGLAAQGREVWLADPGRTYLPDHGLTPLAEYTVPVSQDLESCDVRRTIVYRLAAG